MTAGQRIEFVPQEVDWEALLDFHQGSPVGKRIENSETVDNDSPNKALDMDISAASEYNVSCKRPHGRHQGAQVRKQDERENKASSNSGTKQGKVKLRDAKQVLAEQAEARRREKQMKALESPKKRKSTRKTAKGKVKTTIPAVKKVCSRPTDPVRC